MKNIAIFASGSGTNAENIIKHFENHPEISVNIVLTNNKNAFVLERCKTLGVDSFVFNRNSFYNTEEVMEKLAEYDTDFVVLAGFLWLIPDNLLEKFANNMINVHPALLPHYGGKGMYGMNVHNAVYENKETESGITIHYVNAEYDSGDIIFQAKCSLESTDTPDLIAQKVHKLEYEHFPKIIESLLVK